MGHEIRLVDLPHRSTAVVRAHVMPSGMADFFAKAFEEVLGVLDAQGLAPTGPPFARHLPRGDGFEVTAGFPVDRAVRPSGHVLPDELPGGPVATTLHTGAYDAVGAAYTETTDWLEAHGLTATDAPWEAYLDGPEVPQPRTQLFVPCRAEA